MPFVQGEMFVVSKDFGSVREDSAWINQVCGFHKNVICWIFMCLLFQLLLKLGRRGMT